MWFFINRLSTMILSIGVLLAPSGASGTLDAQNATGAQKGGQLRLSAPVNHVGKRARETMIVEHPSGALFVAGYGESTPTLWKSSDRGKTWHEVNVGSSADGAVGNSDVDLGVAPDGTLYFVTMEFNRKTFEGIGIFVGVSKDSGNKWTWTTLSKTRFDDRPWIEVAPNGHAHVIWNDGAGVCHAVSRDGGTTWTEGLRLHEAGGSSHLAIGPAGEVAVRITPASASGHKLERDVDLIAVSTDDGKTWRKSGPPGTRVWFDMHDKAIGSKPEHIPRWVEPIAWDAQGNLYSLWSQGITVWLAQSKNKGQSWREWRILDAPHGAYFPYLAADGPGELAATWFSGPLGKSQANVSRISVPADATSLIVRTAAPFTPETWWSDQKPDEPRQRDTGGEYFPIAFLRDGSVVVVTTIEDDQKDRFGFSFWRVEQQP
jgi:hypothetical protein